jgi:hypothetical protein
MQNISVDIMGLTDNSIENKFKFVISGIINTSVQFPRYTALGKIIASLARGSVVG